MDETQRESQPSSNAVDVEKIIVVIIIFPCEEKKSNKWQTKKEKAIEKEREKKIIERNVQVFVCAIVIVDHHKWSSVVLAGCRSYANTWLPWLRKPPPRQISLYVNFPSQWRPLFYFHFYATVIISRPLTRTENESVKFTINPRYATHSFI